MSDGSIAIDEEARLAALAELELLDTLPEPEFDHLVELAARISGAPIALLSLVDRDRQWFKARVGLDASETPRHNSFCTHAIREEGLFVVPDASLDPRFANNPLVAGAPVPVQALDVAAAREGQPGPPGAHKRRPLRVLLADDNEINVLTISAFLEAAGHEVVIARDGDEAVDQARAHRPEVILLDLQMPRVDGITAARQIRAMSGIGRPPIVALTAMGRAADRERCKEAGFDAFVTKPVTPETLDAVIATLTPPGPQDP